jgi:uncharacterized protein (DUF736 family)
VLADGSFNATAKEPTMPQIGKFSPDEAGFLGHLTTLMMAQDVLIVAAEPSETENTPQYRVHIIDCETGEAGAEIGAAWKRTGERAGEYLALVIDDPALPQPIRANLFRDDDAGNAWSLHWSRQPKHDGKE